MKLEKKHQQKVAPRCSRVSCESNIVAVEFSSVIFFYSKVAEILQISIREIGHGFPLG